MRSIIHIHHCRLSQTNEERILAEAKAIAEPIITHGYKACIEIDIIQMWDTVYLMEMRERERRAKNQQSIADKHGSNALRGNVHGVE